MACVGVQVLRPVCQLDMDRTVDLAVLGVNNSVTKSNKKLLVAARLSAGDELRRDPRS